MDDLEIIVTSDGSHTLRNKHLNETYHSIHGALQESMHVFIGNGLDFFNRTHSPGSISVLEVGFGTGLNALLTLQYAVASGLNVHYTTIEPFPLPEDVWSMLNYGEEDGRQHFELIHQASWDKEVLIRPEFTIVKRSTSLMDAIFEGYFNIIYYDAFAPSVQPALWECSALRKVVERLHPGGIFVTYSAKGQLKRDLKTLGLAVETLQGPPGKLQMVRGVLSGRR